VLNILTRVDYQSEREDGKQFLAPSVRFSFGLSDYWTLTLFYDNKLINKTPINLWNENPYLNAESFNYSIERIKNKFGLGTIIYFDRTSNLKFEFSRYNTVRKNVFIKDSLNQGYFSIFKGDTETLELSSFLFLDLKKYGQLLFDLRYINSRLDSTTRQAPHTPKLQSKVSYIYGFNFPLSLRLSFLYNSVSYGDIDLKREIPSYIRIDFGAEYQLFKFMSAGLELNNLLNNRKNYYWLDYNEKPIDILLFIKARL
jgi:hypothetical protein